MRQFDLDVLVTRGSGVESRHRVHAAIADSKLVTLDATGHCPQLSAPEATAKVIASFAGAGG